MNTENVVRQLIVNKWHKRPFMGSPLAFLSKRHIQNQILYDHGQIYFSGELKKLESQLDIDQIQINGDPAWPIFRYSFWMLFHYYCYGHKLRGCFSSGLKFPDFEEARKLGYRAIDDQKLETVDHLFFANLNSPDLCQAEGQMINRVIDPVFKKSEQIGTARKVALSHRSNHVRGFSRYRIRPELLLYRRRKRVLLSQPLDYCFSNQNLRIAKAFFTLMPIRLNRYFIENVVADYAHLKSEYGKILDQFQPKSIFFVTLGGNLPLCAAADDRGINSVELQHGHIRSLTPIYNHNRNVPSEGYKMFPDYMLVWGEYDAAHVNMEFSGSIKTGVIGYPWLNTLKPDATNAEFPKLYRYKSRFNLLILIALQNQTELPKLLIDLIEKTGTSVGWIIRKHPKYELTDISEIAENKNVVIDTDIDQIPILSVLSVCNALISRDSAAVYEANYLRLPSFVYDERGATAFSNEIAMGIVHQLSPAWSAEDLIVTIAKNSRNKDTPQLISKTEDLGDVFNKLKL